MKISVFTTISNPEARQDAFTEAIQNYLDFADEIIVVNGGKDNNDLIKFQMSLDDEQARKLKWIEYPWPEEFDWRFIGTQFQRGYDACTNPICFRMDLDYLIHQDDFEDIRAFLEDNPDYPAYVMPKKQFILVDKYRVKALVPVAFNKGKFGDRIKLDSGGDLCQPSLDGKELKNCSYGEDCPLDKMPIISKKDYVMIDDGINEEQILKRLPHLKKSEGKMFVQNRGIHLWNYECTLRTKEVEAREFGRFARAWGKWKGNYEWGGPDDQSAFNHFLSMQIGRIRKGGWTGIALEHHPKYIQEIIKNLKPEQFGYSLWGNEKKASYYRT